jgi:hypothetical protein
MPNGPLKGKRFVDVTAFKTQKKPGFIRKKG